MGLAATLNEYFVAWALRVRPPEPAPIVLGQRRVYVLPTRAGLGYAGVLLAMLLGAINYNLGLGYVLTFLLAGLGIAAILHTFRNLVRLSVAPGRAPAVFAGDIARFHLVLRNAGGAAERRAIRLWLPDGADTTIDVADSDSTDACLHVAATRRGWLALPRIGLETTYPLGLVRAWAYCAPDFRCLVYPRPAPLAPALPWAAGEAGSRQRGSAGSDDFAGLRQHQPADPPRHVAWKIAARHGQAAPLLTKQFDGAASARLWLDWQALPDLDVEARLSTLTRWALDADAADLDWGLRLPNATLAAAHGPAHLHAALACLALFGHE
jgi:uncharacterized protein (DUF58 family)